MLAAGVRRVFRRFFRKRRRRIVQFSPPRSGSTLVYNILRDLFPGRRIVKQHSFPNAPPKVPVVVTYRHPLDSIVSMLQILDLSPTDEALAQQVAMFETNGIWDVLAIKDSPNVLMLRYEEFVNDLDVVFAGFERFFGVQIDQETRTQLRERYSIDVVGELVEDKKTFAEYDKNTHWHGRHISKNRGSPGYHRELLAPDQISRLEGKYRRFLQDLGYA